MYSGSTLKPLHYFDAWFGAHQKINRIARRRVAEVLAGRGYHFPTIIEILKFEGMNGPDGIKRKTPGRDEPWHYYDPYNPGDDQILTIIDDHYQLLVEALRTNNRVRASFESAWLAHAIVDGLTPAHHYPYEEELIKLRGGEAITTRTTAKEKIILPGDTLGKQMHNNWKMWGDKGLLATHFAFEWGVAIILAPLRVRRARPNEGDLVMMRHTGVTTMFKERARQVADLRMYDQFYKSGWTPRLAKQVRRELLPLIINAVTLAWYGAIIDSQIQPVKRRKKT